MTEQSPIGNWPADAPPPPAAAKKKRKWPWIAGGVVLVLIVIGAATRGGSNQQQAGASGSTSTSSSSSSSAAVSPASTTASEAAAAETTPTTRTTPTTPSSTYVPIPGEHYEGAGDDVVTLTKGAGPALLTFSCPDCQHNVVVDTKADLLVNEIGSYSGTHLIDTSTRSGPTSTVEITADGSWTLDIADITTAPEATSGAGDSVIWVKTGNKIAITHDGEHNFVVEAIGVSGGDLLVNEIGPYQGTKAVDTPVIVDITADGNWTITPS